MAAPTVLRVKRRLEDNPQDALVLLCKRKKTEIEEISPSLFVFRGSIDKQESANFKTLPLSNIKLKQVSDVNDLINKIRQERKDFSSENRYEIVNCRRGLKEESDKLFDLVDLQKKEDEKDNDEFMYDLYTAAKEDFDISTLDDLVGIEHFETELIFGSYRDNGLLQSDSEEDEEDSNAENDYRNEYPDSEASSIDADDMIMAMKRCDIDSLSSDTGEDKIYDEPPDLCNEDVKRYGEAYAKYKAKVLDEEKDLSDSRNYVHCVKIKEVDEDGYKDDSDDGFYYGQEEDGQQFQDQYKGDSSEYEPD